MDKFKKLEKSQKTKDAAQKKELEKISVLQSKHDDLIKSGEKNDKDNQKIKNQNTQLSRDNDKAQNLLTEVANRCEQYQIELK